MKPQDFQLGQDQKLTIKKTLPQAKERIAFVHDFIDKLYVKIKQAEAHSKFAG
jgi:hypothetical protein